MTRQQLLNRPIPPKPKKPVLPAVARTNTTKGAAAFVKYYIATADYGTRTGDTQPMEAAATSACTWCAKRARSARQYKAEGVRVLDPTLEITLHEILRVTGDGVIAHFWHEPARDVRYREKGVLKMYSDPRQKVTMGMVWEDGQWRITGASKSWLSVEEVRRVSQ